MSEYAKATKTPCPERPRKFLWWKWNSPHDVFTIGVRACTPEEELMLPGCESRRTELLECRSCKAKFYCPQGVLSDPFWPPTSMPVRPGRQGYPVVCGCGWSGVYLKVCPHGRTSAPVCAHFEISRVVVGADCIHDCENCRTQCRWSEGE